MARTATDIERLDCYVDLDQYPLHDLDSSAGKTLVRRAHEMMQRDTLCLFEGFLRASARPGKVGRVCCSATIENPDRYFLYRLASASPAHHPNPISGRSRRLPEKR